MPSPHGQDGGNADGPPADAQRRKRRSSPTTRARRQEVLAAAARVLYRKGYRSATIQDIGDELNFSGAALYYYIGSKSDLLFEIITEPNRHLVTTARSLLTADLPPVELLRTLVFEHFDFMLREKEMFGVMLRERLELPADKAAELAMIEDEYYAIVRTLIERAVEAGSLVTESPAIAALSLIGSINWATRWYRENGAWTAADIARMHFNLFYRGTAPRTVAP
jgi:AcrR family transcriptional regulator